MVPNFRRVLNVVCFLLGNSPASEFYMPTFRNTYTYLPMKMEQSVPKRRHIKFRRWGISQKKTYKKCLFIVSKSYRILWGNVQDLLEHRVLKGQSHRL